MARSRLRVIFWRCRTGDAGSSIGDATGTEGPRSREGRGGEMEPERAEEIVMFAVWLLGCSVVFVFNELSKENSNLYYKKSINFYLLLFLYT